jgi:hypothetical protein
MQVYVNIDGLFLLRMPEIKFLNSIFSRSFLAYLISGLLRLEFLTGFPSSFSDSTKRLLMNKLDFFLFPGFLKRIFETREDHNFHSNPPVELTVNSMEQKTQVFC